MFLSWFIVVFPFLFVAVLINLLLFVGIFFGGSPEERKQSPLFINLKPLLKIFKRTEIDITETDPNKTDLKAQENNFTAG